jgi:hypothetical protein
MSKAGDITSLPGAKFQIADNPNANGEKEQKAQFQPKVFPE